MHSDDLTIGTYAPLAGFIVAALLVAGVVGTWLEHRASLRHEKALRRAHRVARGLPPDPPEE